MGSAGSKKRCQVVRVVSATENYGWLGMVPNMREWIGGRDPKRLREFTFAITNKDYEATLEVMLAELRRDQSGQLMIRIAELARRCLSHPAKLMSQKMIDGESVTCYDGQYFFDTDHVDGASGSQSNDLSINISALATSVHGSTTDPSPEEIGKVIMLCIQAILGFKDDQGEPMNENATTFEVQVPVPFWSAAVAATALPTLAAGQSNVLVNLPKLRIDVVSNPRLTWTDALAVFRTDGETKPFIIQEEVPLNVSAVAEGSQLEFTDKKHWYGVDWAGNIDYGFWQHACFARMI